MKICLIIILMSLNSIACGYYGERARTSEAKVQLAAAYTAQQAFYGEFGVYAGCLKYMGYDPSREKNNRYYAVGIKHINISKEYLALNMEKILARGVSEKCFSEPIHFFENGKLAKVRLEDFPEDSHITIDKDGKMSFKIYAIAKKEDGRKSIVSIDDQKKIIIHTNEAWERTPEESLKMVISGLLVFLIVFNAFTLLFIKRTYSTKNGVRNEFILGALIVGFFSLSSGKAIVFLSLYCLLNSMILWIRKEIYFALLKRKQKDF